VPRNHVQEFVIDAMLCDSAVVSEGKLYVQGGGWNMLGAGAFPFNAPRIALAVVVTVPYDQTNRNHTLEVRLEDEDGGLLSIGPPKIGPGLDDVSEPGKIAGQFNMGRPPFLQPGDTQLMPFAVNVDGQPFASPGAYSFVFSIDGEELERIRFRVVSAVMQTLRPAG
jgi:hypothetical protein